MAVPGPIDAGDTFKGKGGFHNALREFWIPEFQEKELCLNINSFFGNMKFIC